MIFKTVLMIPFWNEKKIYIYLKNWSERGVPPSRLITFCRFPFSWQWWILGRRSIKNSADLELHVSVQINYFVKLFFTFLPNFLVKIFVILKFFTSKFRHIMHEQRESSIDGRFSEITLFTNTSPHP